MTRFFNLLLFFFFFIIIIFFFFIYLFLVIFFFILGREGGSFRWMLSRRERKKEDLHHFLFKAICCYNKSYASLHTKDCIRTDRVTYLVPKRDRTPTDLINVG